MAGLALDFGLAWGSRSFAEVSASSRSCVRAASESARHGAFALESDAPPDLNWYRYLRVSDGTIEVMSASEYEDLVAPAAVYTDRYDAKSAKDVVTQFRILGSDAAIGVAIDDSPQPAIRTTAAARATRNRFIVSTGLCTTVSESSAVDCDPVRRHTLARIIQPSGRTSKFLTGLVRLVQLRWG